MLSDVERGEVVGAAAAIYYCCLVDKIDAPCGLWGIEFLWERDERSVRTVGAGVGKLGAPAYLDESECTFSLRLVQKDVCFGCNCKHGCPVGIAFPQLEE